MSESNTRAEIVEVMAHALCEEPECEKCSLDWRGPRGGVRGCIYDATKSADRALTALEASGRAVVPVEPTPAMKEAHRRAYHDLGEIATNQWSAMLAAALPPSKE